MATTNAELALFDRQGWWNDDCRAFASLRSVSAFRLRLLDQWIGDGWRDRTVVDLGCGGGLLALPLATRGARVVGVDLGTEALREASKRNAAPGAFQPVCGSITAAPLADASADVVLLADVLEHVDDPARAVAEAARILRPGGRLFVNTIARTVRARVLAIWLGEGLGLIPRGTHQWRQFIQPRELMAMARAVGLEAVRLVGEAPRLFATLRRWTVQLRPVRNISVGYAALFEKAARESNENQ